MNNLKKSDYDQFAALKIPRDVLDAAHVQRVSDAQARSEFGITGSGSMDGIIYPYYLPNGRDRVTCRLRRDHPEIEAGKLKRKYVAPYGDVRHLYFAPGATELLRDPETGIVFVESEKSALALLAWSQRVGRIILSIATSGVWGWRGRIGKATDASGERVDEVGPLADLQHAKNRTAYILFDANVDFNQDVQKARRAFISVLSQIGANVTVLDLPSGVWNGPDDCVGLCGDAAMSKVFDVRSSAERTTTATGTGREDVSNSERFANQYGNEVRYWHGRDRWIRWSGMHWQEDADARVREFAKGTARSIYSEAATCVDDNLAKQLAEWARKSQYRERINAMLDLAESHPAIAITTDKLDANPYLLNFRNGTLDVRDGVLRPHRREDYVMKLIPFDYVPDAVAPLWTAFVEETFRELAECVQIAVGYSLIGITIEKVVFLLLGPTNSGKTTFLATLRTIFLAYCTRIQIESLMTGRHDNSNNVSADLADLRGARLVVSSETEEGQQLRESKLKSITQGMGTVKAARKYENPIEFTETHTLWIDANHAPAIRGSDDAIWKRLFPFPCRHQVPEERRDRKLGDKFITQATGIVGWAVAGALKYMKSGLPRPEIVEQERARWRESQDVLGEFLQECCVQDEDSMVRASKLYAAYREWIQKQGHSPLSQTAFGTRLFDRGVNRRRERDGGGRPWFYVGLRLQARK